MLAQLATTPAALHSTLLAATTTTTAPKSSSSGTLVLFLVVILAAGYFLYLRPRSRARMAQARQGQARQLEVGDEVATTAGIVGRVRAISDDRVELEIAPGMVIQVLRKNVGLPLAPASSLPDVEDEDVDDVEDHDGVAGGSDQWDERSAATLAPGGLKDGEDGDDGFASYEGPARTPVTSGARSRDRRRPARAAAQNDRSSGWSRTSDETSPAGDDDRPNGSSASGTGV
jgi:preprotein translocase subunit YajC